MATACLIFRKIVTPIDGVGVGGVERGVDGNFLVGDDFAGDEFEREGNAGFDAFVIGTVAGVVPVAEGGADEIFW